MSAKVNKQIQLHQGRVFTMVKENITLDNDLTIDIDIIRHPGASAIIPISDKNMVVLIKQYRHAIGDYIWEIPAGTLNKNEEPLECAKRELTEETGFKADVFQKLGEITPVPGYSDERIHLFLATGLTPAKQNLDADEILKVHEILLDEVLKMIYNGEIQDGKTICGMFMAQNILKI